jgi:Uma2 family endonuclease
MVQAPVRSLSLNEFLALPETKPASEYIEGEVIQKPMPQGEHSVLQRDLCIALTSTFKPNQRAEVFPELRCTFGGRSVVPDVAVFRSERVPRKPDGRIENTFNLPPDWTIEILSPGQSHSKVIRNILHCIAQGTEMGWLLDPEEPCIFVYDAQGVVRVFDRADSVVPVPEFAEAVRLTVGDVFSWLVKPQSSETS